MRSQYLNLLPLALFAAVAVSCGRSVDKPVDPYAFEGSISREVLENYLERAVTMSEFLVPDSLSCDGAYPCKERDVEFIRKTGAKFIGRSILRWGKEEAFNNPGFREGAMAYMSQVHANDPDVIFQAGVFEAVYKKGVEQIAIPAWVFEAIGLPVEERNFRYEDMLDAGGRFVDMWGPGGSVPDITKVEAQLWLMFLVGSYVDMGVEAIHLGQTELVGMNDPELAHYESFLAKVRAWVGPRSRRGIVLFDAHTPFGGMVKDGRSLLDFNSFPLRPKEIEAEPMKAYLEVGYMKSLYQRSMGCVTPSGWECESLPYLVEFDNFGISDHPGMANINDHCVWGYDEISWFYQLDKPYKEEFLRYAWNWIKENDHSAHLQMPAARLVTLVDGSLVGRGIPPSNPCPQGMDIEDVVMEIWGASDQS